MKGISRSKFRPGTWDPVVWLRCGSYRTPARSAFSSKPLQAALSGNEYHCPQQNQSRGCIIECGGIPSCQHTNSVLFMRKKQTAHSSFNENTFVNLLSSEFSFSLNFLSFQTLSSFERGSQHQQAL
ncbi:Toll-like receptor 5 [Frankliniella fusca]|uniref:Toll-like receptor 5 n=1 Tax=Frankliniella fusca TaxID=407009 RepID=A0AAE1HT65_9NEOP|nr:Toll-like receptor 5 [Frankliniella fusca]